MLGEAVMSSETLAMTSAKRGRRTSYAGRRRANIVLIVFAFLTTAIGLLFLADILWTLLYNGLTSISLSVFTESTPPPPGEGGGLLNAIVGSIMMTLVGTLVGTPIGMLAGTYLAEYSRGWFGEIVRFINDILLSAPSIVIGLFISVVLVEPFGGFSGWAGAAALGTLVIPVVVRTTEDMLRLVPGGLREAAAALGATKSRMIMTVAYRAAFQGLVTGVILAIARVSGETAPLLFTALNNQFFSTNMSGPMANLPFVIFQFANSPYPGWQRLAWAGALLITATVLCLNIVARIIASRSSSTR